MDKCFLCGDDLQKGKKTAVLKEKGAKRINEIATYTGSSYIHASIGQTVHVDCRLDFCCRPAKPSSSNNGEVNSQPSSRIRRSMIPIFDFKKHCFLCGKTAKHERRKRGYDVVKVKTTELKNTIQQICKDRNDDWAKEVSGRIEYVNDLHAADAVYHSQCNTNFRTNKQIPKLCSDLHEPSEKIHRTGRPASEQKKDAFMKVIDFLKENDEMQVTVTDLCEKMQEYLGGNETAYSVKYMKSKLLEHFGQEIIITTIMNVANVVTFHRTATSIINEFYCQPKENDKEKEKLRMVKAAAELIRNEIKTLEAKGENYPSPDEMSSTEEAMKFVPDLLQIFLASMIRSKDAETNIVSLGQALTQAVRPKSLLAPLQLGLAIQMHHHFSSKFLIDSLNSHGFCSSYSVVQNYERAAAVTCGTDIPDWNNTKFMQHSADNVDHNTRTLDGTGTFHGMGIIVSVKPSSKTSRTVPYRTKLASKEELCAKGTIPIIQYQGDSECVSLKYKDLELSHLTISHASNLDMLFKVSLPLLWTPRPSWLGTMQLICKGTHPGNSSVIFLPMIDMDPSDLTCVNSTFWFNILSRPTSFILIYHYKCEILR